MGADERCCNVARGVLLHTDALDVGDDLPAALHGIPPWRHPVREIGAADERVIAVACGAVLPEKLFACGDQLEDAAAVRVAIMICAGCGGGDANVSRAAITKFLFKV